MNSERTMKRFYVDESYYQQWGLQGTELLVFAALRALCNNPSHSWKGSDQDLANESRCGSYRTAGRALKKFADLGIISLQDCGRNNGQIVELIGQNVEVSKKEEKNQKNKEVNINNITAEEDKAAAPASFNEIILYGKQQQIPEIVCKKFYSYYTEFNWRHKNGDPVQNWKATLYSWFLREKKEAAKSIYQNVYGVATEQEQAAYSGAQYEEYRQRKDLEEQEEKIRQANDDTKSVSFDDYKKSK